MKRTITMKIKDATELYELIESERELTRGYKGRAKAAVLELLLAMLAKFKQSDLNKLDDNEENIMDKINSILWHIDWIAEDNHKLEGKLFDIKWSDK